MDGVLSFLIVQITPKTTRPLPSIIEFPDPFCISAVPYSPFFYVIVDCSHAALLLINDFQKLYVLLFHTGVHPHGDQPASTACPRPASGAYHPIHSRTVR